ncbi:MAG: hypothetical protein U1E36_04045 [Rickettsiales bacterium]
MEISNVQNQQIANNLTAKAPVDQPVTKRSEVVQEPVKVAAVEESLNLDIAAADEKRLDAIKESLRQAFKNVYAVSDQTVTIYKDMSGQYITRYKNLRDGTMTYIPEPEIMRHINAGGYFTLNA